MLRDHRFRLAVCLSLVVALSLAMVGIAQDDDDDDDGRGSSAEAMNRLMWIIWRLTGPENWGDVRMLSTTDDDTDEELGERGDYF